MLSISPCRQIQCLRILESGLSAFDASSKTVILHLLTNGFLHAARTYLYANLTHVTSVG